MKKMTTEKRMIEVEVPCFENSSEGPWDSLLGKYCYVSCCNYAYAGTVLAINDRVLELSSPEIVYNTGAWTRKTWEDSQKLPTTSLKVSLAAIEACFEVKER